MKIGDTFTRMLGGTIPMTMRVTDVLQENVYGQMRPIVKAVEERMPDSFPDRWTFDLITGAEIDLDLGWGPKGTGSIVKEIAEKPLAMRLLEAYDRELLDRFDEAQFEMFFRTLGVSESTLTEIKTLWNKDW